MCLDANERHWLRMSRQHRKLARSDDDWLWENLLGHTDGGLALGDMSLALLAHGNALRLPGHPPHMYLVPHLNDSLRRTGHLLLHSNSMEHVGTVLRWLQAVPWGSMRFHRKLSVTMVTRDDLPPSAIDWQTWHQLRSSPHMAHVRLKWFVQNMPLELLGAQGRRDMPASLPGAGSTFPLPIGVRMARELETFLLRAEGLETRVDHRSTLLMCLASPPLSLP